MAAVVVTETLDWRLHGFDLVSEHSGSAAELPLMAASWMVQPQYKPSGEPLPCHCVTCSSPLVVSSREPSSCRCANERHALHLSLPSLPPLPCVFLECVLLHSMLRRPCPACAALHLLQRWPRASGRQCSRAPPGLWTPGAWAASYRWACTAHHLRLPNLWGCHMSAWGMGCLAVWCRFLGGLHTCLVSDHSSTSGHQDSSDAAGPWQLVITGSCNAWRRKPGSSEAARPISCIPRHHHVAGRAADQGHWIGRAVISDWAGCLWCRKPSVGRR